MGSTKKKEVFGVNFFAGNVTKRKGILRILVPKFNKNGDITKFDEEVALFTKISNRLVPVNDTLERFSKETLSIIYKSIFGKNPIANTVKILPKIKDKNIKFE